MNQPTRQWSLVRGNMTWLLLAVDAGSDRSCWFAVGCMRCAVVSFAIGALHAHIGLCSMDSTECSRSCCIVITTSAAVSVLTKISLSSICHCDCTSLFAGDDIWFLWRIVSFISHESRFWVSEVEQARGGLFGARFWIYCRLRDWYMWFLVMTWCVDLCDI